MPPQHSKKRKSDAIEDNPHGSSPATPTGGPVTKRMKINQSQKQALIDNLQLEITERARHLRAHYALQAVDLRSRIERRINRIPIALRKETMGDLLAKHAEVNVTKDKAPLPISAQNSKCLFPTATAANQSSTTTKSRVPAQLASSPRGKKRRTSVILILSDKENEPSIQADRVTNPKNAKRAKTGASTTAKRAASRTAKAAPTNVLSPKSHNSRTLPRSPIKEPTASSAPTIHSPSKLAYISRPVSPIKPASPLKSAASAAGNAISASLHGMVEQAKRGAGTASSSIRRTASKEKAATAATAAAIATDANSKRKMAPPPMRPRPATGGSQQGLGGGRPASQASTYSTTSISSATSNATTVVTRKATTAVSRPGGRKTSAKTTVNAPASKPSRKGNNSKTNKANNASAIGIAAVATNSGGGGTTAKASALRGGGSKKSNTTAAASAVPAKKVVLAEPAAGKRVLRKRTPKNWSRHL